MANRARVAAPAAPDSPRRATRSTTLTDAAVDEAKVDRQRSRSVTITTDVSRAMLDATNDDRLAESALGNLVANALRDSLESTAGGADIGMVNPGGLRASLTYRGQTSRTTRRTPTGVVTYAEANAVLPFVNNLWTVTLTGAELKASPRAAVAAGWRLAAVPAPRPVRQHADDARPDQARGLAGHVGVDRRQAPRSGQPSTRSRRSRSSRAGGDNFTAFTKGTYCRLRSASTAMRGSPTSAITPRSRRRSSAGRSTRRACPRSVVAGQDVDVRPHQARPGRHCRRCTNTEVERQPASGGGRARGSPSTPTTWTPAAASVAFTAPSDLVGEYTVVAEAQADRHHGRACAQRLERDGDGGQGDLRHGADGQGRGRVDPCSDRAGARSTSGSTVLGTGTVDAGTATVKLGRTALQAGCAHPDGQLRRRSPMSAPSQGTVKLTVVKATSKTKADQQARQGQGRQDQGTGAVTRRRRPASSPTRQGRGPLSGGNVVGSGHSDERQGRPDSSRSSRRPGTKTVIVRYLGSTLPRARRPSVKIRVVK